MEELLQEQTRYYRAVAAEYDQHALPFPGWDELVAALETFKPEGSVLELACGPGTWTGYLRQHATDVTAVDASPEMMAIAEGRVGAGRVRFVRADLFRWRPDRRYDVVFFGFWLSHVPDDRFEGFWEMVGDCLVPGGRVFFVDDAYRSEEELIEGEESPVVRRRLLDGTAFQIVKVPYRPEELERRLAGLGWRAEVRQVPGGPFFWGSAARA